MSPSSISTCGRPGGTRTPNNRFWRPVLCRLSYWPPDSGQLPRFPVHHMFSLEAAILLQLNPIRSCPLVLRARVTSPLTARARQRYHLPRHIASTFRLHLTSRTNRNSAFRYFTISTTVPAPMVLPPSRMAKRIVFSIATGCISETSTLTLSPGMTISAPSGSVTSPVTSVVRK
jgi:hypothetical protein